ncbi:MAG: tetratricopeptide repeat protein [Chloroflexi bacterium]|nr:MAG: tetratricopeptide repeat protein [Chloroflexota bacterium]
MAGNKEAYQKAMNQGHSAAWDQEWEQAAECYSTALEEFPNHPQALSSLGLALFELQDYPAALQCYQRAAALAPEDPAPHEKVARIYERMGRLNDAINSSLQAAEMHLKARSADKAIDNWTRVISIQPENVNVRTRLAAVYERIGRKSDAATEYISLASIYQRSGDLTRATKMVEHAYQMMPENQEVRMALSMLRGGQLLPRPARPHGGTGPVRMAHVREMQGKADSGAVENDPIGETRQKALVDLAALLFDQADENTASSQVSRGRGLSALARGLAGGDSSESSERTRIILHLGQAIDSQTTGDANQTIVELEHALNLGLRQPGAYFILGQLLRGENLDRAQRYLQQSVKHPDYAMASHLLIAQIYEKTGQWPEAAGAYIQALGLADAQMIPADQAEQLISQYDALNDSVPDDDTVALQAVCKAVSSQLNRTDWRSYLARVREQLPAQPEGSPPTPVSEMVLETRSTQVVETMAQVRRLAENGMLRSAFEEALYALQYAPTYLPLHVLIGDLLIEEGRSSEAVQKFLVVSELYTVRREVTRAVRMLKRISQIVPTDVAVRQRIIDLLVAQDKVEDALQEFTNLADLYYRLAELDKARQTYLDALNVAKKSKDNRTWGVNLLLKVADIDMQRINLRQALRVYEQIRAIQPDNPTVRSQIVNLNFRLGLEPAAIKELDEYLVFLESSGRRQDAIMFISDLLVDHSNRIDLRRRLADLYLRNNQTPEAVTQLDAAADALLSAGKHYEAINLLETIITLNPSNIQEYRTALESLRREMLRK